MRIEEKTPLKPRYEVKEVVLPLTEQPLEQKHKVRAHVPSVRLRAWLNWLGGCGTTRVFFFAS